MMWCSAKGRDRDPEQRALPITPKLAQMLRARAIARGPSRPLFDRIWGMSPRFRVVLERLGLDLALTPYMLRHQFDHPANPQQHAAAPDRLHARHSACRRSSAPMRAI